MATRSRDHVDAASAGVHRARHSGDVLLDTAARLMTERDSIHVTFVDIAKASGLNSALIHYRFGGKHGLFRALIERDIGGALAGLEQLVAADLPAAAKLARHVEGVVRVFVRHPYLSRLIAALAVDTDSDSSRFLSERLTRPIVEAQTAILAQGEAEGTFRRIDPELFYFTLVGACDHPFVARGALKWVFGRDTIDEGFEQRFVAHVTGVLLGGVVACSAH